MITTYHNYDGVFVSHRVYNGCGGGGGGYLFISIWTKVDNGFMQVHEK